MVSEKILRLREKIKESKLDYWLVARGDAHQHELVQPSELRLAWLTNFSGSAGFAIVGLDSIGLFVDGRYKEQAAIECAAENITILPFDEKSIIAFLENKGTLGLDGRFITRSGGILSKERLLKIGVNLRVLDKCLVEEIWHNRPSPNYHPCWLLEQKDTVSDVVQRVKRIRKRVNVAKGTKVGLLMAADTSCWLLGVRGDDISEIAVVLSRAMLVLSEEDWRIIWYVDGGTQRVELAQKVLGARVEAVSGMERLAEDVKDIDSLWVDPLMTNETIMAMCEAVQGVDIVKVASPVRAEQTIKTEKEKNGFKMCHLRDGVMMVKLLHWIATTQDLLDELTIADKIASMREQVSGYKRPSFAPIVGSGGNGSIIHYRVNKHSNRNLRDGELLLIDCGGHYEDGTTDISRTVAIGNVDDHQSQMYTMVLKAHIALSMQRFPEDTSGSDLDVIARSVLWSKGLEYNHGTGHGVGHVLAVHESPPMISRQAKNTPILEGMVLSIEPGYYEVGKFGCRIENLAIVEKAEKDGFLKFTNFTCVPYDRNLIVTTLLNENEKTWINHYHEWVFASLSDALLKEEREWLKSATRSI